MLKTCKDVHKKPVDTLIKFLQACHESKELYEEFFCSIYKPLHEQFVDERTTSLSKDLGGVLEQWSSLLEPGPINHKMLSPASADVVHSMKLTRKPRDSRFNLVLRLVPDFAIKAYEALFLARQWRNSLGVSGYSKELKLLQKRKRRSLQQHDQVDASVLHSTFCSLERKLNQSRESAAVTSTGHARNESAIYMLIKRDREVDLITADQVRACPPESVDSSAHAGFSREQRIDCLRADLKREQTKVQRIRSEILQGEIALCRTTEKVMLDPLLNQLACAKANCDLLRREIFKEGQEDNFSSLQSSLPWSSSSVLSQTIPLFIKPISNSRYLLRSRDHMHQFDAALIKADGISKIKESSLCS